MPMPKWNGFRIIGNRPSTLDAARYCGLAPKLSEAGGVQRSAEVSGTFHALAAGESDAPKRFARLSSGEQAELAKWKTPSDVEVPGATLRYTEAIKEADIGLDEAGIYRDPTKQDVFLRGTADMYWVAELETVFGSQKVVYVGDLKKSRYASSGPDTLQCAAYGFGIASMVGAEAFCCGLWYLEDSEWEWSRNFVELGSGPASKLWDVIVASAEHKSDRAIMGDHCLNCWGRLQCEAWSLAAAKVDPELEALAAGAELTGESLGRAAFKATNMKRLAEAALERVKSAAYAGNLIGGVKYGAQEYRQEFRPGRESVDIERLRSELGAEAEKYIRLGRAFPSWNWRKAK